MRPLINPKFNISFNLKNIHNDNHIASVLNDKIILVNILFECYTVREYYLSRQIYYHYRTSSMKKSIMRYFETK